MARTGRRPGASSTRDDVLEAARARFAADGFRGATIRAIAADAGVDPAMVHHWFGTKQGLFAAVMDLPVQPATIVEALAAVPADQVGVRMIETFLDVWEEPDRRDRLTILVRTAVTNDDAARMIREFLVDALFAPVARRVSPDRHGLRATLAASQMIGFAMIRYVLRIEPMASASPSDIVAAIGPVVQHHLTADY